MSRRLSFHPCIIMWILFLVSVGMMLGCAGYRDYINAEMLYGQGERLGANAQYLEAIACYEEAAKLYERSGYKSKVGEVYIAASEQNTKLGNLQKGLDYAQKAVEIQLQVPDNDMWQWKAYMSLGVSYHLLGEYDKSNDCLFKSLEISIPYRSKQWRTGVAEFNYIFVNGFIGNNYREKKDYSKALEHHLKALRAAREWHTYYRFYEEFRVVPLSAANAIYKGYRPYMVDTFNMVGEMALTVADDYRYLEDIRALEYYDQALYYGRFAADKRFLSRAYQGRANVYFSKSSYDKEKALDNYLQSLSTAKKYHLRNDEMWAHQRLGHYYKRMGELAKANSHYKKSIESLESIRGEFRAEEIKTSFLANKIVVYEELISLLLEQKQDSEAFDYVERARSRAMLDMLGNRVKLGKTKDATLGAREQELNRKIEKLLDELPKEESKPEKEQHREVITKSSAELEKLRGEYQTLLIDMKQKSPELASLVSVDPLKLPEIRALTGGEFAILEYYVIEKETLLWVVDKDSSKLMRIAVSRQDLESKVEAFRNLVIQRAEIKELQASSQELYTLLLAPAMPQVRNKTLCIVPHGVLHYLPFQALQDKESQYLVQNYALFYASSASVLKFTFQKRRESSNKLLALGNPDLGNPAFALPFAEEEVKEIGQHFSQKAVLVQKEATKRRAKEEAPTYDLLHFACHGDLQEFSPMFSALQLAPAGEGQDGRLEVHEIFNLDLNASLVTLSACKTGLGKLKTGDELIGLTRAFIYAGTPAAVASLWAVEDRSTYLLMSKFYQNLKTMPKAEALRTAQLEVAKEYPHPFFWAAFTLAGDWK